MGSPASEAFREPTQSLPAKHTCYLMVVFFDHTSLPCGPPINGDLGHSRRFLFIPLSKVWCVSRRNPDDHRARSPASDNLIITIASRHTHTTTPSPSWRSSSPYSASAVERSRSPNPKVPESSPAAAVARRYSPRGLHGATAASRTAPHITPPILETKGHQ